MNRFRSLEHDDVWGCVVADAFAIKVRRDVRASKLGFGATGKSSANFAGGYLNLSKEITAMNFCVSRLVFCLVVGCMPVGFLVDASADDLSDNIFEPNLITIGEDGVTGFTITNSVFESDLSNGETGNKFGDIDFFNVEVASGFQLDDIELEFFDGGGLAFFGFAQDVLGGNPAIADEQAAFVETALGFTLIDGSENSLFSDLAQGADGVLPGAAFDPSNSLGPGTYAFVFQNTGPNVNNYSLTFTGSAIPEPTSTLLLTGLGAISVLYRRNRDI